MCHDDYFVLSKVMHSSASHFVSWNLLNIEDVSVLLLSCFFRNIVINGSPWAFYKGEVYVI